MDDLLLRLDAVELIIVVTVLVLVGLGDLQGEGRTRVVLTLHEIIDLLRV